MIRMWKGLDRFLLALMMEEETTKKAVGSPQKL